MSLRGSALPPKQSPTHAEIASGKNKNALATLAPYANAGVTFAKNKKALQKEDFL